MDRLESVRKILEAVKKNECSVGRATHQIYSLFELEVGYNNVVTKSFEDAVMEELEKGIKPE